MVSIQERANAFLDVIDRPVPKFLLWCWGVLAAWDTFVSQFIPEETAKSFPKAHQVIAMTSGWLSIQTWVAIGATIIVLISLEYAARHKWQLDSLTGDGGGTPKHDSARPVLVAFWLVVAGLIVTIWLLDAAHWTSIKDQKIVTPLKPQAPTAPSPMPSASPAPSITTPTPTPKGPWVSGEEVEGQRKLGRVLLIYSPQELFSMFEGGQNLEAFALKWIKVEGTTATLPVVMKIQNKDYYRVDFKLDPIGWNRGVVAALFDSKKWENTLINIRLGGKLRAICQYIEVDHSKINPSYEMYLDTIFSYNCEPF